MARRVKDATLDSREARRKLTPRGEPYYRVVERGVHLGFRRRATAAGTWLLRHYTGTGYKADRLGIADDFSDADGAAVLSYWQAVEAARHHMTQRGRTVAAGGRLITVAAAMDDYLAFLDNNRRSAGDARYRDAAFIRPELGKIEPAALTAKQIRDWHAGLAKKAPRLRTKKGKEQKFREIGNDDESKRRRRASANRTLTVLKAALNRAWREGKVSSDAEWRRVEPFENVDAARVRYLTVADAKRLINASSTEFRKVVQAALETGCRYGELTRLTSDDFNPDAGTLAVRMSKSGKPRHVVLTDEGMAFFKQVCAGRAGSKPMFCKANGKPWKKSHQNRPMADACERAKIKPAASFHVLRHTWASLAVMNGVPLLVVARNLGHADTRMVERHYGHLAPSYVAEAIRAGAPKFGFKPDRKVAVLAGRA